MFARRVRVMVLCTFAPCEQATTNCCASHPCLSRRLPTDGSPSDEPRDVNLNVTRRRRPEHTPAAQARRPHRARPEHVIPFLEPAMHRVFHQAGHNAAHAASYAAPCPSESNPRRPPTPLSRVCGSPPRPVRVGMRCVTPNDRSGFQASNPHRVGVLVLSVFEAAMVTSVKAMPTPRLP